MKIGVLTSSRADYGIYLPLLKAIMNAPDMDLGVIAFGTHLSKTHGHTVDQIVHDGFPISKTIDTNPKEDSPLDIAKSYALTAQNFAEYWSEEGSTFDVVFALGDRFEMAAAVAASIPFGIKIAHLHGGETTLGAIDNIYRHSITLASTLHFVSAEPFLKRVKQLHQGESIEVYNVGSLSLENIDQIELLDKKMFLERWGIDLNQPTILVTVHPETVDYQKNEDYSVVVGEALNTLAKEYQVVITLPNADTMGNLYRKRFVELSNTHTNVFAVENFGTQSYFTCMNYAQFLLGNTSSGIIEAASFNKYVINIGDRQKGRLCGDNVIHVPFDKQLIIEATQKLKGKYWKGGNLYHQAQPSRKILDILRTHLEEPH